VEPSHRKDTKEKEEQDKRFEELREFQLQMKKDVQSLLLKEHVKRMMMALRLAFSVLRDKELNKMREREVES
jgi:hypothetical protein